jgi:hypothetical protein
LAFCLSHRRAIVHAERTGAEIDGFGRAKAPATAIDGIRLF